MGHVTERIVIKEADIDFKIIPIVNWLNSFQSVITSFSCEGDDLRRPYIMFSCGDMFDLTEILKDINNVFTIDYVNNNNGNSGEVKVDYRPSSNYCNLRFNLLFTDHDTMLHFAKVVNGK